MLLSALLTFGGNTVSADEAEWKSLLTPAIESVYATNVDPAIVFYFTVRVSQLSIFPAECLPLFARLPFPVFMITA